MRIPEAVLHTLALLGGSLWITGRGMDLFKVDPRNETKRARSQWGTARTLVAVGTCSEASMFVTMRAAAPRSARVKSASASRWARTRAPYSLAISRAV